MTSFICSILACEFVNLIVIKLLFNIDVGAISVETLYSIICDRYNNK